MPLEIPQNIQNLHLGLQDNLCSEDIFWDY